jgi:Tfp pilus assembly protein FimT
VEGSATRRSLIEFTTRFRFARRAAVSTRAATPLPRLVLSGRRHRTRGSDWVVHALAATDSRGEKSLLIRHFLPSWRSYRTPAFRPESAVA